ncbi:MAG TPA: peptide-methionine (S)-S-oxide reductase MsrA [Gammaproteobacteria bacterium]|jgi:peptide-methionine (S)-S-oxide reductase|nr:peptide-methionine (S)-S-oxide reductase MsrA [Gammaproteobacteria bacterium]
MAKAMFAAGCFWGVEELFRQQNGVLSTQVGYAGGHTKNPTYKEVCLDTTGHAEVVAIEYDPAMITFETLVQLFFDNHNPTTKNRQGPDIGSQYRSIIFYDSKEEEKIAQKVKNKLEKEKKFRYPIVTEIIPTTTFYPAEDYHQRYLQKQGRSHCNFED